MKHSFPLVLITLFSFFIALYWFADSQDDAFKTPQKARIDVIVEPVKLQTFTPVIESYGRVQARTRGQVVSQVGGNVTYVSPNLRSGGFFKKGELLVSIDKRDYQANVNVANAGYLDAKREFLHEQALAKQASHDWYSDNTAPPPELVSRQPQLASTQAKLLSAQSALEKAQLNLQRTDILAPYDGHTLKKQVSIGQVVAANSVLGEIYAIDALEIRLPLKNNDLDFVKLPEISLDSQLNKSEEKHEKVDIFSTLGRVERWQAELIRTEGEIDQASQQLHVIVQIREPFGEQSRGKRSLKIGQYVNAKFNGISLNNVAVVPLRAIYQDEFVYIVKGGNQLVQQKISIAWRNNEVAVINDGLQQDDTLVLTPLSNFDQNVLVNPYLAEIATHTAPEVQ